MQKLSIAAGVIGLLLAIASFIYGASPPIGGDADATEQHVQAAVQRHAHIEEIERATQRGKKKEIAAAQKKYDESNRRSSEIVAARESAIARHGLITSVLRYGGSVLMLCWALPALIRAQSH